MAKKYMNKKAMMSYTQILILVISIIAFSFLVGSLSENVFAQGVEDKICCTETKEGQTCQNVVPDKCKADSQKSPNECKDTNFCGYGCCFSDDTGLCNIDTPKLTCENANGIWFDNLVCNIKECGLGCCILGSQGVFTTERNCEIESEDLGIVIDFRPEVKSQTECIFLTEKDDEGACVLEPESIIETKKGCIFTTRESCVTRTGSESNFYKDTYCSNPELNTSCEIHSSTNCGENKAGDYESVYWYDSCGNKEEVKESCGLDFETNCGQYRPGKDEKPDEGDYVCRDMGCDVDVLGEKRHYENGEAWCEYEGIIGDGKDTVGSRHTRHICYLGEEKIEPCSDYRNQICVGTKTELADGEEFSEAFCRVNHWRECYQYNSEQEGMAEQCAKNPDCKIQGVHIDKFSFDVCVPNYPPGFDIKSEDPKKNGVEECSIASQQCIVVYVKRFSGWKCEMNCDCEDSVFTQQMNDLCINLGDCGGYVNYVGEYTDDGYTSRAGRINGNQYKKHAKDDPNQEIAGPGPFGFSQILGMPFGLGEADDIETNNMLGMLGAGLGGIQLLKGTKFGKSLGMDTIGPGALTKEAATQTILDGGNVVISSAGQALSGIEGIIDFSSGFLDGQGSAYISGRLELGVGRTDQVGLIEYNSATGQYEDVGAKIVPDANSVVKVDQATGTATQMSKADAAAEVNSATGKPAPAKTGTFGKFLGAVGAGLSVANFLQSGFGVDKEAAYAAGGVYALIAYKLYSTGNPILIVIGLVIQVISMILGLGKSKKKIIQFNCLPWQPPAGGLNCDLCNTNDPLSAPCSEYKCGSLGQTCEFINVGTIDEKCVENDPYGVGSPRITPMRNYITEGYDYKEIQNNGFSIKTDSGDCIPEYEMIEYGIETDKPAQCRIGGSVLETYDEMQDYFGNTNSYLDNHTNIIFMPSPAAFRNQYNLTDAQIEALGDIRFYVRCKSINGFKNPTAYTIKTCVKPGPDLTAPRITRIIPNNNDYIKYGEIEKDIFFWTNEPADCKYSIEDKDYDNMENSVSCQTDLEDYGLYGWTCNTTLTGLNTNTKFYIKCKDQPWLSEINESRNKMMESYVYELQKSESKLIIEDFRPIDSDEIFSGIEPVDLEFKLKTSGGADGTAFCSWEGNGYSDDFTETDSIFHSYPFPAYRGAYNINFLCEDAAGNTATAETSFKVKIDSSGPRITRIYYDAGLKIWTNEQAECRYDFKRNFKWDEAEIMSGDGLEHTADWQLRTYYIQCKDEYGNKGGKVAVKAYSLIN